MDFVGGDAGDKSCTDAGQNESQRSTSKRTQPAVDKGLLAIRKECILTVRLVGT